MSEKRQIGAAVALIRKFEGCRLQAYRCPANIPTIGYGHTGPEVHDGLEWTQQQADDALMLDLCRFVDGLDKLIPPATTDNQYCALLSFSYNLGLGSLERSALLSRFRAGDVSGAASEFMKWVHAGGVELPGLVARREAERKLFLGIA